MASERSESPAPAEAPSLRGVLETSLYVEDIARAREWYRRVLGLRECAFDPPRQVFFPLGEGMLLLFNPGETERNAPGDVPAHGARGRTHVAFEVAEESLPSWKAHLKASGVEVEKETSWPGGGRSVYFRDPDGNSLELATRAVWG